MSFAILRTAKLKTLGNIGASAKHTFREIETPNADSEKTHLNTHIGAQNSEQVLEAVKARLPEKVRTNAVLAIEYLMTASPEFFARNSADVEKNFFARAEKWLREKHGSENVVYCGIQKDESNPHMVAYVVPIDQKGKLNARSFLGGRDKLRAMQTDFAQKVGADFGLDRGIEGSKLKHERVQRNYALIKKFDAENDAFEFKWSPSQKIDIMRGNLPQNLKDYITTTDTFRVEKKRIEKNMQMMSQQIQSQRKGFDGEKNELTKTIAEKDGVIQAREKKLREKFEESLEQEKLIQRLREEGQRLIRQKNGLTAETWEKDKIIEDLKQKLNQLTGEYPRNAPEQPTTLQNDLDRGMDTEANKSRLSPDFDL